MHEGGLIVSRLRARLSCSETEPGREIKQHEYEVDDRVDINDLPFYNCGNEIIYNGVHDDYCGTGGTAKSSFGGRHAQRD